MSTNSDLHDPIALLQRVHRWRAAFFCLVILIAGITMGASGMFMWQRHKAMRKPTASKPTTIARKPATQNPNAPYLVLSKKLDRHLGLSEQQYQTLLPVLRYHLNQLNKIKAEARPKIREQLTSLNEKVIALLNDKQKAKWRQDFRQLQQQFQLNYRTPTQPTVKKPDTNPNQKEIPAKKTSASKTNTEQNKKKQPATPQKKPTP